MSEARTNEARAGEARGKPEGASEALLDVRGLRTWFPIRRGLLRRTAGYVRAVDGVDIALVRGTTHALVGESGCGKTTVGRSILRLVEPTAGEIWFGGQNLLGLSPDAMRPLRRRMQMIFQDPMTALDPRFRVRDLIAEGMESFGIGGNAADRTERVAAILRKVKLDPDHMWRYPHEFSGGQRQRVGIARALAVEPDLVICDEAVSALDVSIQAQILNLLAELRAELGLTYLFITHDLSVVRYLADEISVMYLGQIVEQGPTEALLNEPRHPYTEGLMAAVPSVDPNERRIRPAVLGDLPSPAHPPAGCRFHTRCPKRFEPCDKREPALYPLERGGASRCFLVSDSRDSRSP
ncbi:MAG TPA: ABC transporter ATP-binding protein [Polyangiaceae bacterium]|jgi:peptide/nickel transport system ATP-binding protein|nr:ABC transporter ATP-binding protein [Polyangiaceae bacterium]